MNVGIEKRTKIIPLSYVTAKYGFFRESSSEAYPFNSCVILSLLLNVCGSLCCTRAMSLRHWPDSITRTRQISAIKKMCLRK
ncbi:hypothetical protein Y032_0092g2526 [Ancylostoma ceylanicum]|uniref:Uncharacterized protein n=1 Tax=Ancylostoma ceylanicum TaxID=53326 RepID=A0A016TKY6_9BILA|nr:hypothetical protein Y032_0092g2526 [Ancylostoma ceylanicum]